MTGTVEEKLGDLILGVRVGEPLDVVMGTLFSIGLDPAARVEACSFETEPMAASYSVGVKVPLSRLDEFKVLSIEWLSKRLIVYVFDNETGKVIES